MVRKASFESCYWSWHQIKQNQNKTSHHKTWILIYWWVQLPTLTVYWPGLGFSWILSGSAEILYSFGGIPGHCRKNTWDLSKHSTKHSCCHIVTDGSCSSMLAHIRIPWWPCWSTGYSASPPGFPIQDACDRPGNLHFLQVPRWWICCLSGDHTFVPSKKEAAQSLLNE